MAALSNSCSSSPAPLKRRRKNWARKCERYCCSVVTYFPLAFVYGLATWAVWVEAQIGFLPTSNVWTGATFLVKHVWLFFADFLGYTSSIFGIALYLLLNWAYTTAVFTDPGSTLSGSGSVSYSHLPSHEPPSHQDLPSFTVKSTGESRFCKKCQARKPDRAHHCSTCGRCRLKMDHHCPWLATCVGLRNYKAFLLFLLYTSVYCWLCFAVTATWLWSEAFSEAQYTESLVPINYVMLCVISGIIGVVLTGFTAWHFSLAWRGQTTIECLENTRYLSPARKSMKRQKFGNGHANGQSYGQQLVEIHANVLPGVTREEEGEDMALDGDLEDGLMAEESAQRNYHDLERSRERERYEGYLDEQDSEKLPNAFDHGWRRNLRHLFGDKPLLWFFPICNTSGNGWHWEPSQKWVDAREEVRRQRENQWVEQQQRGRGSCHGPERAESFQVHRLGAWPQREDSDRNYLTTSNGVALVPSSGSRSPGKADKLLGRSSNGYFDDSSPSSRMSLKTFRRRGSFDGSTADEGSDEVDSQEEERTLRHNNDWHGASKKGDQEDQERAEDEWREWD